MERKKKVKLSVNKFYMNFLYKNIFKLKLNIYYMSCNKYKSSYILRNKLF